MTSSAPPKQPPRPAGPRPTPSPPPRPSRPIRPAPTPKPSKSQAEAERLYTVAEVAELWSCSRQHVYNLIARGELRRSDIGIRGAETRIPASVLAEFVERRAA